MCEATGAGPTRQPWWRRRLTWALVTTLAFAFPIAYTLASRGAPDRMATPIGQPHTNADEGRRQFTDAVPDGDAQLFTLWLHSPAPLEVLTHPRIAVPFFPTDLRGNHTLTGRIEVIGTKCAYQSTQEYVGRALVFVRAGDCRPTQGRATGEFKVTMRMVGPGGLGYWAQPLAPGLRSPGLLYLAKAEATDPEPAPVIVGSFVDDWPDYGYRRVNLLSYMWTGDTDGRVIWVLAAVAGLLVFAGALIFPVGARADEDGNWGRQAVPRAAVGAGCLAAGLALLYALAVPPLHAADETPFARAYSIVNQQPEFLSEIRELAKLGHFERIRYFSTEHFRPRDVGHPFAYVVPFDVLDMQTRSSLTTILWVFLGRHLPKMNAFSTFAVIRLIHVVLFSLAMAMSVALVTGLGRVKYPQFLCFPFLFVPTIPFFGMQFSETAILTCAVVFLGSALMMLILDGGTADFAGLPLGVGLAALLLTTRSALPMVPLVAIVLLARMLLGPRNGDRPIVSATVFWIGLAVGIACFFTVATVPHLTRILETTTLVAARSAALWPTLVWALNHPWLLGVVVAPAVGWAVEVALTAVRRRIAGRQVPGATTLLQVICYTAAAAIVVSLVGSYWLDYPDVENIQSPVAPGVRKYIGQVVIGMATIFRFRHSSTFLSDSFWVGFGWLDTMPGDGFVAILVTLTGVSLMAWYLHIAATKDWRRALWMIMFAAGSAATLAFYAFSAKQIVSNLHGRYLMPWYLPAVAVFWLPVGLKVEGRFRRLFPESGATRGLILLGLIGAVHAYSLCFILRRYF